MKCHIVDIRQIREDNRQIAIDNAWNAYLAAIRESVKATEKVNDMHSEWMKLCAKEAP